MKRIRAAAALLGAFALSGCLSSRMGQDIECKGFNGYVTEMNLGAITTAIQTNPGLPGSSGSGLVEKSAPAGLNAAREIDDLFEPARKGNAGGFESLVDEPRNILLLSGGGQWGAYGAGLFLGLACPTDRVTDRHNGALPCHDAAGNIDANALDFKKLDDMEIKTITGVSTGGLQASLLMIVFDRGRKKDIRAAALGQLVKSYLPARQGDLVDYSGFLRVPITGSVAGTGPLRRHVGKVYEDKRPAAGDRSFAQVFYDKEYTPQVNALVGFVDGSDGKFKYVSLAALREAIHKDNDREDRSVAKLSRCMQAATLASSAMPVFHQQLRVVEDAEANDRDKRKPDTLFDGGVRRSVFIEYVGAKAAEAVPVAPAVYGLSRASGELAARQKAAREAQTQLSDLLARRDAMNAALDEGNTSALSAAISQAMAESQKAAAALDLAERKALDARRAVEDLSVRAEALPKLFVLRNGPTTREEDKKINAIEGAEPQAMRAYDLLVNELEVGSIASLRLQNPLGKIKLSTAEGIATEDLPYSGPKCPKRKKMMFDPVFMRCLLLTGVQRAQQEQDKGPWWLLPTGETGGS